MPPTIARTFWPGANRPSGSAFTTPTHSMPLISATSPPGAFAEIDLGVIEAEGLHFDDDMTGFGLGRGTLLERQHFGSAVLLDDDGTHD